jgi:protein-tyrosine-phosphatase
MNLPMIPRLRSSLSLLLGVLAVGETSVSGQSEAPTTILFLCPHGGAKSVIAASYFNRLANERGLLLTGVAAATEEPSDRVPSSVVSLLAQQGIDVSTYRPRRIEKQDAGRARRVVAIDCDLGNTDIGSSVAERWDDVPKVSEDLPGATRAIRRHVEKLVQEMAQLPSSCYTWAEEFGAPNYYPRWGIRTCIPP